MILRSNRIFIYNIIIYFSVNKSEMSIILLNNLPIESGVGRYAYNLYFVLKDKNIKLLNFPNYFDYKNRTFEGKIIIPKFKNKIENILFNNIINRRQIKYIYNFNGIIHYTNYNMSILRFFLNVILSLITLKLSEIEYGTTKVFPLYL